MGKNNSSRNVTVGGSAYSFYDASTGIYVTRGEKKLLSARQLKAPKVRKALVSGHLEFVAEDHESPDASHLDVDKLVESFKAKFEKGMDIDKLAKAYNKEQAIAIASNFEIEADDNDTVKTLLSAVIEELTEKKD